MKRVRFLHLSDTHLSFREDPSFPCAGPHSMELLYETASRWDDPPAFALLTGDFVHEGTEADYRRARRFTDELEEKSGIRTIVCLGNHDRREKFYAGYLETEKQGAYDTCLIRDGVRILVLDTSVPGRVHGRLSETQLAWLRSKLRESPCLPTLIAMHHSPLAGANPALKEIHLQNAGEFWHALQNTSVCAVLAGHEHMASVSLSRGIPVCVAAGLASALLPSSADVFPYTRGGICHIGCLDAEGFQWSSFCLPCEKPLHSLAGRQILFPEKT